MKNIKLKLIALFTLSIGYTSCSNDDENTENNAPTISIQSPELNQTYIGYWGGAWPDGDKIIVKALGTDEDKVTSMNLTVKNADGTVVLDKTINNTTNNDKALTISESFEPTDAGNYNVIFSATDINGNIETSKPRFFLVK
ncbi:hypothetical protein GCM10022291_18800 [Postechiella marina]|uniref:Lipoprotein n=1 Tax=Postechiella marina TaxID=943941 RepID=A0ABP8C914_9FLAO